MLLGVGAPSTWLVDACNCTMTGGLMGQPLFNVRCTNGKIVAKSLPYAMAIGYVSVRNWFAKCDAFSICECQKTSKKSRPAISVKR
jgi:hypothetical protein